MLSITYTYNIEIVWKIKGYDNYGFGKDKNLYNLRTNRRIKKSYNSGSIGYWISKKFYTLNTLRKMLIKPEIIICPF